MDTLNNEIDTLSNETDTLSNETDTLSDEIDTLNTEMLGGDVVMIICDYLSYTDIVSLSRMNRQFNKKLRKILHKLRVVKKYAKIWQMRTFDVKRFIDLIGISPSAEELRQNLTALAAGRPDLCRGCTKRIFIPRFTDICSDFVYAEITQIDPQRYGLANYQMNDTADDTADDIPIASFNLTCNEHRDLVDIGMTGLRDDTIIRIVLDGNPIRQKRVSDCVQYDNITWLFDKYFQLPVHLITSGITIQIIGQTIGEIAYIEIKYRYSDRTANEHVWVPCLTNIYYDVKDIMCPGTVMKNILLIRNGRSVLLRST